MTGHLDKVIQSLVLILPKMSGFVKNSKEKNNKLMYLCINDEKPLEKYKTIWTKIENLKNLKLNSLPIYDDRYTKTKIKTYGNKVYANFHNLNVPKNNVECETFSIISIDSLLVYENKYYVQAYLHSYVYKTLNTQMVYYLGDNIFESD